MATRKQFVHLTATHPLVKALKLGQHEWWATLVDHSHKDPDINIQVRGDYLSVYSRMGSLLTVRLDEKKQVVCSIHYKYLIASRPDEYVNVFPDGKDLAVKLKTCDLVTSILEEKNLKRIKLNIARLAGEEKTIQSTLVAKNRSTLLDVEIAFSESGALIDPTENEASSGSKARSRSTRIDLVNFDKNSKALVFIELKQIFDGRLYSDSKGHKEVNKQIEKYKHFAENHADELIKTYNDVIEVKKELGLLPKGSVLWSAKIEGVEPKPILAIAGHTQDIIDARRGKVEENLDNGSLSALYFFGSSVDLNLSRKKDKNKVLFPKE
jgi:hypothetical protein